MDGVNTYRCRCPPNFTGDYCEIDVDECSTRYDRIILVEKIFLINQNQPSDPPSAKMAPHAQTLTEVMRASALTDGLAMTAAKISTIVWMQRVLTAQLASMALEASVVDAHPERLDYCAIWTMLAPQIPAMRMPYARPARSMGRSLARVLKATKAQTARKTSMSASKVRLTIK